MGLDSSDEEIMLSMLRRHPKTNTVMSSIYPYNGWRGFWHGLDRDEEMEEITLRNRDVKAFLQQTVAGEFVQILSLKIIDERSIGISSPGIIEDPSDLEHVLKVMDQEDSARSTSPTN